MSLNTRETETDDVHFRVIAPLPTPVPNLYRPALDIVVPVHNQAQELARAVRRLRSFLRLAFPFSARITIADCASTDSTRDVATALAAELVGVRLIHLNEAGRGRALAAAWMTSDARIVASADAGLDIDVSGLPRRCAQTSLAVSSRPCSIAAGFSTPSFCCARGVPACGSTPPEDLYTSAQSPNIWVTCASWRSLTRWPSRFTATPSKSCGRT